ncbi:hypothetical protein [Streptomyces sp. NPDC047097]|uniref:hypothetical protein n=1 Tax=Streptomyces sp. NPDC047097 TaxID=3155260 RepID=UPI0034066665
MRGMTRGQGARLSLASLTGLVLAFAGPPAPSYAAPSGFLVEVTLETVTFQQLSDCALLDGCPDAEMYGSFYGQTLKTDGGPGTSRVRNIGKWGKGCEFGLAWTYGFAGQCPVGISDNLWNDYHEYKFADRLMCSSHTYKFCESAYSKANNTFLLTVRPGERIKVAAHTRDYDADSAHDDICFTEKSTGPLTASALAQLDRKDRLKQGFNGDGSCEVAFTLRTVGTA